MPTFHAEGHAARALPPGLFLMAQGGWGPPGGGGGYGPPPGGGGYGPPPGGGGYGGPPPGGGGGPPGGGGYGPPGGGGGWAPPPGGGYGPPPAGYGGPPGTQMPGGEPDAGLKIAALVLAILGGVLFGMALVPCLGWINWFAIPVNIAATVVGIVGMIQGKRPDSTIPNQGYYIAALVIGAIGTLGGVVRCVIGGGIL